MSATLPAPSSTGLGLTCPVPGVDSPGRGRMVAMKHGAGGRAMRRLIQDTLLRGLADLPVDGIGVGAMDDGAAIRIASDQWLVITTDSHVVHPIFFPGGDIGRLAIAGTVNDLAMMGAPDPLGLTCALILEEGFPLVELERIQESLVATCREAGAPVVTGDTKVMGKGEVDRIVINTAGVALTSRVIPDSGLMPGDTIIVTGTIADHGVALMAVRNNLELDGDLSSDVQPINRLIRSAIDAVPSAVVALKDPTRGGVSSALHEMADKGRVGIVIHEAAIPISPSVRAAAEMLGLDPLHIANEGKAIVGVRGGPEVVANVLEAIRQHPAGRNAAIIGECIAEHAGRVILDTGLGRRLVAEPEGEPLPRIC